MNKETNWTLFPENEKAWESMLADCARAEKSIVLEQFIFATDDMGQRLIDICAARAKEGVRVRFLWDAAGSFSFWGLGIEEDMRKKGIELRFWKTLIPGYFSVPSIRSWFLRNHRRTLVIDDEVGYTGSICVNDSMKNWRDTNVRLEGRVVSEMSNAFERMWERSLQGRHTTSRINAHDPQFEYITNDPTPGKRHLYKKVIHAIKNSHDYLYITTPYFVPTHKLIRHLKNASERGVDVRIILPEKSDHYPALDLGARSFFSTLMESGVKIYLYASNIIHSKTIVVDSKWATVGSLNLDSVSLLYNFEANIVTRNPEFAEELKRHFMKDLEDATQVNLKAWKSRFFLEKIPELLIKIVRKFL
jgi:cardiolipin synthase